MLMPPTPPHPGQQEHRDHVSLCREGIQKLNHVRGLFKVKMTTEAEKSGVLLPHLLPSLVWYKLRGPLQGKLRQPWLTLGPSLKHGLGS